MRTFALLAPAFGAGAAVGWTVASRLVRRKGERDGLTGLLRREAFERRAPAALTRATVIGLLDVDDFKGINDVYGHLVGDQVLRALAERLSGDLAPEGVLGRFGGDEFVLLARLELAGLAGRVDRLTATLSRPVPVAGGEVPVAVSLGVARLCDLPASRAPGTFAGAGVLLKEALGHADVAMYAAKNAGTPWQLYDPGTQPARPAAGMHLAPARRYREHGRAALADDTAVAAGQQ